jgi:MFS family permease
MTNSARKSSILSSPGSKPLLASSIIARLPLAMFSIALLVHAQRLTGSFAVAGLVSGAYAICGALAAPMLGRLVDRGGQTRVLLAAASVNAVILMIAGLVPSGTPAPVLVLLGGAAGLASPPLEACVRTLLPTIVTDPSRLPALFAFESTALELTFVFGPPLALGVGEIWSPGAALALSGLVLLVGTVGFAVQPASRRWRPDPSVDRPRGGSLRSATIRTFVMIELGTGAVFGATEVGVTATTHALHTAAAAGPLLALWGAGSLIGGIAATRMSGASTRARGGVVLVLLTALALTHGALTFTTGSVVALGAVILLAGATIAPTFATIYAMVGEAAPAGTETEAFSWLLTAASSGAALGAAVAGVLAQNVGPAAAFGFGGAAGGVALAVAVLRSWSPKLFTRLRESASVSGF